MESGLSLSCVSLRSMLTFDPLARDFIRQSLAFTELLQGSLSCFSARAQRELAAAHGQGESSAQQVDDMQHVGALTASGISRLSTSYSEEDTAVDLMPSECDPELTINRSIKPLGNRMPPPLAAKMDRAGSANRGSAALTGFELRKGQR